MTTPDAFELNNVDRTLLENVLDRANDGNNTPLTGRELAALARLLGAPEGSNTSHQPPATTSTAPISQRSLQLDGYDDEVPDDVLMCLDFGTSFSKSFAVDNRSGGPTLIDLPIGSGDSGREKYFAYSDMLIEGGHIFFGSQARSRVSESDTGRIIDSPKQLLTMSGDTTELRHSKLDKIKDPHQSFSRRDIILLYLSYLNFISESRLEEAGHSINTQRRFTHPAWNNDFREGNKREMESMMAEAIVLSRTIGSDICDGLSVETARSLLDAINQVDEARLPNKLVVGAVREATAAGAGALLATDEGVRQGYIIVDVGAGTTDIAGFIVVTNANTGQMKVWEVAPAAQAIRFAGNLLDQHLTNLILGRAKFVDGTSESTALKSHLRREVRTYKETLFNEGHVVIELPNDNTLTFELEDFLSSDEVQHFENKLRDTVSKAVRSMEAAAKDVKLVATGGGAKLPMVRRLTETPLQLDGGERVSASPAAAMSDELRLLYPDLEPVACPTQVAQF